MDNITFVLCLVLASLITIHLLLSGSHKKCNLPPGPCPLPIFGNLFCLGIKPHITLTELAKKYGPLMTLKLGQVQTVVISSALVAKEALHKNDHELSSRHVLDAIRALNHHQKSVAWLPSSSPEWKNLRKVCNALIFSRTKLDATQELRANKVKDLISYVDQSSHEGTAVDIGQAVFTTLLNLLSSAFFSVDLGDPSSEFAREVRETIRSSLEAVGKPNFADHFPVLQRIDPQGIKRRATVLSRKVMDLFKIMIDQRLERNRLSVDSVPGSDVLDELLRIIHDEEKEKMMELSNIPHLLLDIFNAGTDTTSNTVEWAMAELLHNPEKLKKARAELQEVIGNGNPFEEPDIFRLPYLQAIVKETLRLHPPAPLLLPRKADTNVQLLNYTIPKNTKILINVWAIGRDLSLWNNPNCFEPERFLGSEIDVKGRDFELIPFGAGRRICPGLPLATRMIPFMIGSLIHRFDWKLENGVSPENMNMEDKFGITLEKAQRLRAIPTCI